MVRIACLAALAVLSWIASAALAQTVTFNGQTVDLNTVPAEIRAKIQSGEIQLPAGAVMSGSMPGGRSMRGGRGGPRPGGGGGGESATEASKPDDQKKQEGDQPADQPATVKPSSDGKADPNELKAKPDEHGKVQFSFNGQPWADVLKWYADISKSSLDWQELPAENLNLITQRPYTIDETRNLLNRYLLARGFTMLHQGDVLSVMKLDKIDPSLVPRIEPDDLEDHLPFDFGRVRFDLPKAMDPAKAVEDVKVLLNPTAKVTPLLASKQIMVIDAVANLRDVRDLLYSQQMAESSDVRPEMFQIRHRRADYIADQIMIVLGLDPSSRKTPMELQLEQQRMQLMMQMQQQGKDISNMLRQEGPQVFIAVDRRRNTVSVNAPPKEMEVIKRVVEQFDVPSVGGVESASGGTGYGSDELVTKRYRTTTVSPDAVVTALKELANLSPLSQLQSDQSSKTIFATGTAEDHKVIAEMLAKFDSSSRRLHVIWLSRRTPADQVAGTIQALMVGEKKEETRRPWYYYDYYGSGQQQSKDDGFRIQADVEYNRLIVMATDDEFKEVTSMLEELGVITNPQRGRADSFRVLEARDPRETAELLRRLQEAWGGANPLNINVPQPPAQAPAQTPPAATQPTEEPKEETAADAEDTLTQTVTPSTLPRRGLWMAQYVETAAPAAAGAAVEAAAPEVEAEAPVASDAAGAAGSPSTNPAPSAAAKAPPINVTMTPDGRIVISSEDPVALDQLEELLGELAPPAQDFKLYQLKYADCFDVYLNLKDYFEDDLAADSNDRRFRLWNGFDDSNQTATLGKRRKLRFIYDPATNTVLAQNASPAQLAAVDELVRIYDQPVGEDAIRQRRTAVVQVRYSRAQDIATAVKDVYRDLLSSKDKEFQNNRNGDQRGGARRTEIYYRLPGMDNSKNSPVKVAFEGALSIGVDTISNTLIISAEEQIIADVERIVKELDEQAKPETVVSVQRIGGSVDAEQLRDALQTALSRPWPGGNPDNAANRNNNGGRGNNGGGPGRGWRGWRGDGGGDRGRDRGNN
jgi:type II secretory pathway component GspD/PulD (secretin)